MAIACSSNFVVVAGPIAIDVLLERPSPEKN